MIDPLSIVRRQALVHAAEEVCSICGGRVDGPRRSVAPNARGYYTHGIQGLCLASVIWKKIEAEDKDNDNAT